MGLEKYLRSSCSYTNQTRSYFWIKDRKKAIHVDLFTDKLGFKKKRREIRISQDVVTRSQQIDACTIKTTPFYLGHLDHVGKLCQTGDGDHIVVGFQLVPGEVIKHSVWFQSHIM